MQESYSMQEQEMGSIWETVVGSEFVQPLLLGLAQMRDMTSSPMKSVDTQQEGGGRVENLCLLTLL